MSINELLQPNDTPTIVVDSVDAAYQAGINGITDVDVSNAKVVSRVFGAGGTFIDIAITLSEEIDENGQVTYGAITDTGLKVATGLTLGSAAVAGTIALAGAISAPIAATVTLAVGSVVVATAVSNAINNNIDLDSHIDDTIAALPDQVDYVAKQTVETVNNVSEAAVDYGNSNYLIAA